MLHAKNSYTKNTQEIPPEASGFLSIGNINLSIMQEDISLVEKKAITIILKISICCLGRKNPIPQIVQMGCHGDIHHSSCSYHWEECCTILISIQ